MCWVLMLEFPRYLSAPMETQPAGASGHAQQLRRRAERRAAGFIWGVFISLSNRIPPYDRHVREPQTPVMSGLADRSISRISRRTVRPSIEATIASL